MLKVFVVSLGKSNGEGTSHFLVVLLFLMEVPRVRVIWDEDNLAFLEACKSPKQKINEPKTPYHAATGSNGFVSPTPDEEICPMEAAAHAEAIRCALSEVASTSGGSSSQHRGGKWVFSENDSRFIDMNENFNVEGIAIQDNRLSFEDSRVSFEEHRRKHYDEFHRAKMMRMHDPQHLDEVEEEDKEIKLLEAVSLLKIQPNPI